MARKKQTEIVADVAEALRENAEFHRTAAKNVYSPELKEMFAGRAQKREDFAEQLEATNWDAVDQEREDGFLAGAERGVLTVKSAMTIERDKTDEGVLEESQEEDGELLDRYRKALSSEALDADLRRLLEYQYEQIQSVHSYARAQLTGESGGIVVGLFEDEAELEQGLAGLRDVGLTHEHIGIFTDDDNVAKLLEKQDPRKTTTEASGAGMLGGTAVGGVLGIASGVTMVLLSGVGALLGAIGIAAAWAGTGATFGGLLGALLGWGISEEDTRRYVEGVRRGEILLAVETQPENHEAVERILRESGGHAVATREDGT